MQMVYPKRFALSNAFLSFYQCIIIFLGFILDFAFECYIKHFFSSSVVYHDINCDERNSVNFRASVCHFSGTNNLMTLLQQV